MSSFGESMAFALSDTDDCGPNYCGGEFLSDGQECDFHKPRRSGNGVNTGCKNHDFNYGRYSHPVADKILVNEIFSGKHLMPADYSGRGYYDFLRQMALGAAFWLKSYSSAEQVPEIVTYPWEGLKNSEEEPMAKENKGKKEKAKPARKKEAKKVKQVVKHEKQEKKTLDNIVRNEKHMAKELGNKVSAAPMMSRLESSLKRKVVNGRVVVEATMPLGPITMSTTNKYLDVLQVIKINPMLFKDTSIFAEAKVHEKYKVKHTLVYESSCGANNGGVIKCIFDPDPHDEYGTALSQGQDLQNQWSTSWSCFQEKPIRGKVVKSPLLWSNNVSQGLDNTSDTIEERLTDAGTWVIYCRLPPSQTGVVGEFCLVAEFTFYKVANEGMWSYGIGVNSGVNCPENGVMPRLSDDGEHDINQSLHNFLVGDQIDLNDELGNVGFTINSNGLSTQSSGAWIVYFMWAYQSPLGTPGTPLMTQSGWDDINVLASLDGSPALNNSYVGAFLLRKRTRSSGSNFAHLGLSAFGAAINYDYFTVHITPINEETYELLAARGGWTSEPPALVKGKGNKLSLPKPIKWAKPTKTERLSSKSEKASDVGPDPNTGGDGMSVKSTYPTLDDLSARGLNPSELAEFRRYVKERDEGNAQAMEFARKFQMEQNQEQSKNVVTELQRKIERVNNQLEFISGFPDGKPKETVKAEMFSKPGFAAIASNLPKTS